MIYFLGTSHAAQHLRDAAIKRGLPVTDQRDLSKIIFISEDTPTDNAGKRDLMPILGLIQSVKSIGVPLVLTSQVPPGFTRSLAIPHIYHQAETLRIKDSIERAMNPEYIAIGVGMTHSYELLPAVYRQYLDAFPCPKFVVTYEEAEFSKIAVNMMLAAQVDMTNKLAKAASKAGATWWYVKQILQHDSRIGPHAYLDPGKWQDSKHLYRDYVTLEALSS